MKNNFFIIAKQWPKHGMWFYCGKEHMHNVIHRTTKKYKTYTNAQKRLDKLHIYDKSWCIVQVEL